MSYPNESLFTQKQIFYDDYTNDRTYSTYNYNTPTNDTYKITVSFYNNTICKNTPITKIENNTYNNLTNNPTIANWDTTITTPPTNNNYNIPTKFFLVGVMVLEGMLLFVGML
jgi:hypothetical protein